MVRKTSELKIRLLSNRRPRVYYKISEEGKKALNNSPYNPLFHVYNMLNPEGIWIVEHDPELLKVSNLPSWNIGEKPQFLNIPDEYIWLLSYSDQPNLEYHRWDVFASQKYLRFPYYERKEFANKILYSIETSIKEPEITQTQGHLSIKIYSVSYYIIDEIIKSPFIIMRWRTYLFNHRFQTIFREKAWRHYVLPIDNKRIIPISNNIYPYPNSKEQLLVKIESYDHDTVTIPFSEGNYIILLEHPFPSSRGVD